MGVPSRPARQRRPCLRACYSISGKVRPSQLGPQVSSIARNKAPLPALSSSSYSARISALYDAECRRVRAFAGTSGSGTCSLLELTSGSDSSLALDTMFQDLILPHPILTQRASRTRIANRIQERDQG